MKKFIIFISVVLLLCVVPQIQAQLIKIQKVLNENSDVNISSPTSGQAFVYNNTTGNWENSSTMSGVLIDSTSVAAGALSGTDLVDDAITAAKIEEEVIDSTHIKNSSISWSDLVTNANAIDSSKVKDSSLSWSDMVTTVTNYAKTILDDADEATLKATVNLEIGIDVQAYDADLTTYAGITPSANIQSLLGSATYSAARTNIGLAIGSDVQQYATSLDSIRQDIWKGSLKLTTLGTVTTGTWNAGAVTSSGKGTFPNLAVTDSIRVGTGSQSLAKYSSRSAGNQYEFGHSNAAGYGSNIGANAGSGLPFIAFNAEAGTELNTFKTRGIVGTVIQPSAGGLLIGKVATATADSQAVTNLLTLDNTGTITTGTWNAGAVTSSGNIVATNGIINSGVDNTTRGTGKFYGGSTAYADGYIYLYLNAVDDTTYDYWTVQPYEINFALGTNINGSRLVVTPLGNLSIAGATATKASGTSWAEASDERIKENIQDITNGLETIRLLKPKTYNYTDKWILNNPSLKKSETYRGFIADDVQTVIPKAVSIIPKFERVVSQAVIDTTGKIIKPEVKTVEYTDLKVLDASDISVLAVAAIKELDTQLQEQKAINQAQQKEIDTLKADIIAIKLKLGIE